MTASTDVECHVTALIVTYNHERFVAEAISSALAQQTRFRFEILISEDASTDKTGNIVEKFADEHPELIRVIRSRTNIASNEVVARGLRGARGTYVALLDGDDCWTDPTKLQYQADLLDSNRDCSMCFVNAGVEEEGRRTRRLWTVEDHMARTSFQELWDGNPFATCTSMLRTSAVRDIPCWYADFFPITDWPLYLYAAQTGPALFSNRTMGLYRIHAGGQFRGQSADRRRAMTAQFYRELNKAFGYRYDRLARGAASRFFFDWAQAHLKQGDVTSARSCALYALRVGGIGLKVRYRDLLRLLPKLAGGGRLH